MSETLLIYGNTRDCPDMRHAVPLSIIDPFLYLECGDQKSVVITNLEASRVTALDGFEVSTFDQYQVGLSEQNVLSAELEICVRACEAAGITEARVPATFPLALAVRLAAKGIALKVDLEFFEHRRRTKTFAELAGIRRAQLAAEAGMYAASNLLASAVRGRDGVLEVGREPVTSELVKEAINAAYADHAVVDEGMLVVHGAQIYGHDQGSGPIMWGEPVVIDLGPRDQETGCYTDMSRTFVAGPISDEMREYRDLVWESLQAALSAAVPGASGPLVHKRASDVFEAHGYDTQLSVGRGATVKSGFHHGLGHGVGLQIHEPPYLLAFSGDELAVGDVIALEPGLYREGYGGCRLEDIAIVGDGGAELVTDYSYALEPSLNTSD